MQSVGLCGVGPRRLFDCLRWPDQDRHHHDGETDNNGDDYHCDFHCCAWFPSPNRHPTMRALLVALPGTGFSSKVGGGKRPRQSVGDLVGPRGLLNDRNRGPLTFDRVGGIAGMNDERELPVGEAPADRHGAITAHPQIDNCSR